MPWCDQCSRFWTPTSLPADGTCPTCGRTIAEPTAAEPAATRTPWHFKLLLVAVLAYLAYRFVQIGVWIAHRL